MADIVIDANSGPINGPSDILDVLNDKLDSKEDIKDDDNKDGDDNDESSKDDDSIEIDENDIEKEPKVEIKEDEDELAYSSVPSRKAILKEFPELYKKFPALEKAIYREQQYAEIFPTLKEAKAVVEDMKEFRSLEANLVDGNVENLFKTLKNNVPDAYSKITDNILETLSKVDGPTYNNVLHQFSKALIINAHNAGVELGGEDGDQLKIAAELIHKFLYKTTKISAFEKKQIIEDPEKKEFATKQNEYEQTRLTEATKEVSDRASNILKNTISKHIDVRNSMSEYVRDKAIGDAYAILENTLMTDRRFRASLDRLWVEAKSNNYNDVSKTKIRNALLAKAQTVIGGIISDVRAKALKGSTIKRKLKSEDEDEYEEVSPKKEKSSSSNNKSSNKSDDAKIPAGMSTREWLDMKLGGK